MWKLMQWCGCAALAAGVGLAASTAQADTMFSWTTEDGVYAYTDDPKKVPARYREQVVRVERRDLADYERFTQKDAQATDLYAARISARLAHLRAVNAREERTAAAAEGAPGRFSLATGRDDAPRVSLDSDSQEPVVIEPIITKRPGDTVTRRTTVVRQGGRTLAIVKGSRHHRNPSRDVIDERDLF